MYKIPELYYDGQYIDVLSEHHDDVVSCLTQSFKWKIHRQENWLVDPLCSKGQMTNMDWGTWVVSYISEMKLPHHYADHTLSKSNIRLCFRVNNIEKWRHRLEQGGVHTGDITLGPGPTSYVDVWISSESIRLTLQEDASMISEDEMLPSWVRVGVSNLDRAIAWYETYLGMKLVSEHPEAGYAVMKLKLNHQNGDSLWVVEQHDKLQHEQIDDQVQPICWIQNREALFQYQQYLKNAGVVVSEIGGFKTRGLISFHFYDPDGNRINISSL